VLKRYRQEELSDSVISLLSGQTILVKPYDARTRELNPRSLVIEAKSTPSVIIVEGVITLAMRKLRQISALKIFVESRDCTRVRRLISFYRDFKMMRKSEYKAIIKDRETEEVPFIKSTVKFADLVLSS
jgi:uridine kinase